MLGGPGTPKPVPARAHRHLRAPKPFRIDQLLSAVEEILDQQIT
jgi:hypothetical protein